MKKIVIILFLLLFFLFTDIVFSKKLSVLPELNRPFSLLIEKDRIFITDGPVVYIHSMKDFSLLHKFGKAGEGPGEFKVFASINQGSVVLAIKGEKIMLSSLGRISFYNLNGEFIEQKNIQSLFGFGIIQPFNDRYVGLGAAGDASMQYFALNFYDSEFKKGDEMIRISAFEQGRPINPVSIGILPPIAADNRHIFFLDYEGIIHMFDHSGKKIRVFKPSSIDKDFSRIKIDEGQKNKYIQYFLSDPRFKVQFERDRNNIEFPEYFPEIKDFRIDRDKIYAVTFRELGKKKELCVLNLKGQLIHKLMVPLQEINPRELNPYTIKDDRLYQLVENTDSEEWEFQGIDIF